MNDAIARWGQFWKIVATAVLALVLLGFGGRVPLELKNLQTVTCPDLPEYQNLTTSGASAARVNCYIVQGTVVNPTDRTLFNADIFGRIYDANGNDVLPERTRLGSIEEVPAGESSFDLRISVSQDNPMPLSLQQFKAAGFSGAVRR
jgi:hypothetical protein